MSPIGRIFVVINLVLAAVFLGVAASFLASNDQYRSDYEKEVVAKSQMQADLDSEITAAKAELAEATRQREDMRNLKAQLETQNNALEQEIASKTDSLSEKESLISGFNTNVGDLAKSFEGATESASAANEARAAAIEARVTAENAMMASEKGKAEAEDKVNMLTDQVASLEAEISATRSQLQSASTQLTVAKVKYGISDEDIGGAAPPIEGAVLGVSMVGGSKIVQLNVGSQDQVAIGHVFEIYNGSTYKGQARVEIVHDGTCTARMIAMKDGAEVMQSDRASTQI